MEICRLAHSCVLQRGAGLPVGVVPATARAAGLTPGQADCQGAASSVTDSALGAAQDFPTFPQVSMPFKSGVVRDYLD
jgi:hypothetical protein